MNIDELTLGQIKKLKSIFANETSCCEEDRGWKIVILQRGWVMVGRLFKVGSEYILKDGAVIRSWGTSRGLGEIATGGPTRETKLDPVPETKFHELTVIAQLNAEQSNWCGKIK